jgi:proton-dependent oligopeptide transporter, POT family
MSKPAFLTAPQKTDKMPPGIPYIVGNEAAERFNFYGMRAILFVFMTKYLMDRSGVLKPMDANDANRWYHTFLFANYFFPTIGAIVSDAFWGKYKTILWLSLVYCLGSVVLAFDHTRLGLTLGLTLIAMGSGGIKPCVSSHVGDQFGPNNQHLLARAFGWFYFSINAGSSVSIYLIPKLLEWFGPFAAFGLPAFFMLLATYVFWTGRYKFAHIPPAGMAFIRETFSREGLLAMGRLAIVFSFMIAFWSLWDQSGSEWVEQAEKMDLHFLGINWLASQVNVVNAIMVLAFIPLCQYLIYPAIDRIWKLTSLRKIGFGLFFIALSFVVSAWIEKELAAGVKLNVGWQMPAFALLTLGEVMASITALEFAYTQAPRSMKSVVQALYLLSISFGNLFTALVHWFIKNPDGSLKLTGAPYYMFYAGVAGAATLVFIFFALRYRGQSYMQGETPLAPVGITDQPSGM